MRMNAASIDIRKTIEGRIDRPRSTYTTSIGIGIVVTVSSYSYHYLVVK